MFMLESTHRKKVAALRADLEDTKSELRKVKDKWNSLVEQVNAKGGMDFLNNGIIPAKALARALAQQLSADDIKRLLLLCHPDKHGGKPIAQEMTQKLLAMR